MLLVSVGTIPRAARGQAEGAGVTASLHASVASIAPGAAFDLAIRFALPDETYLYWENPGQLGAPPHLEWSLPDGFTAAPPRFPAPKRIAAGGVAVNALEGAPILVSTITPPADLAVGATAKLQVKVSWVAGGKSAGSGAQTLALALPTAAEAAPVEGDDEFLFRLARRMLPVPTDQAKDLTLRASASKETVSAGDTLDIVLDVKVKPGYHTQSHTPLSEFFVPTSVFPRLVAGITYEAPSWPEPQIREDRNFGRVSEFGGSFQVRVPVRVTGATATGAVTLSGLFLYQACNDQGQCHPPEAVEWAVAVQSRSVDAAATVQMPGAVAGRPGSDASPPAGASGMAGEPGAPLDSRGADGGLTRLGLIGALIGGFLGGLILNIMPCVLPVISIKILSFVQQAGDDPRRVFRLGLTFAAGIVVSFLVIAAAILTLQATTQQTQSWGTLFQRPAFVFAMIVVMYAFALNLFGVYEIMLPGATTGSLAAAAEREGYPGAFMKGVLATLLATPCTAPFLASAVSFALAGNKLTVAAVFTSAGIGMAAPYVLLTARPAWMKFLPKPGNWMIAFKQFMGFLLVGTAVWLLWVLAETCGAEAVVWTVSFLAFLGLGLWLFGKVGYNWNAGQKALACGGALAVVLLGGWFSYGMYAATSPIVWVTYAPGLPQRLAAEGRTVYVDYTAVWCLTCQVNKKVVFGSRDVLRQFEDYQVVAIKADYSAYDPAIADDLKAFNRDAVPLNVVYPAGRPDDPIVLPVVLTPGRVLEALSEAGPSRGAESAPPVAAATAGA